MTTVINAVNSPYSRAIISRKVSFQSLQAQRVMNRSFDKVKQALFSLSVIIPLISKDDDEIKTITAYIDNQFSSVEEELSLARDQLTKLLEDNGIDQRAQYSKPVEYELELDNPKAGKFLRLVSELDKLIALIDTAWISGEFDDSQRKESTFRFQQRLIKLAGRLIGLEKRSRLAAYNSGKETEVKAKAPNEITDLDEEITSESNEVDADMPLFATG